MQQLRYSIVLVIRANAPRIDLVLHLAVRIIAIGFFLSQWQRLFRELPHNIVSEPGRIAPGIDLRGHLPQFVVFIFRDLIQGIRNRCQPAVGVVTELCGQQQLIGLCHPPPGLIVGIADAGAIRQDGAHQPPGSVIFVSRLVAQCIRNGDLITGGIVLILRGVPKRIADPGSAAQRVILVSGDRPVDRHFFLNAPRRIIASLSNAAIRIDRLNKPSQHVIAIFRYPAVPSAFPDLVPVGVVIKLFPGAIRISGLPVAPPVVVEIFRAPAVHNRGLNRPMHGIFRFFHAAVWPGHFGNLTRPVILIRRHQRQQRPVRLLQVTGLRLYPASSIVGVIGVIAQCIRNPRRIRIRAFILIAQHIPGRIRHLGHAPVFVIGKGSSIAKRISIATQIVTAECKGGLTP